MIIKRIVFSLILLVSILAFLVGCRTNAARETPGTESVTAENSNLPISPPFLPTFVPATPLISPQSGTTVGSPFLPGEVLAGLPVYPNATPTTYLNPGFGPPSFPSEQTLYGSKIPGYQSASAEYTVTAVDADILDWYIAELGAQGYRHDGEDGGGNGTISTRSIAFYLPSQPLISVQVHVYFSAGSSTPPVFELLVTNTVPLPKPTEEKLPDDINSVQLDYAPDTANAVVKTVTDAQSVKDLVNMVNNLPVRPDYIILGGPGLLQQTLFLRLVFHSTSQGDITVTDVTFDGIHFGEYPLLDDPHNLLQEAVKQVLGIPGN
jgi:hypothetical protein